MEIAGIVIFIGGALGFFASLWLFVTSFDESQWAAWAHEARHEPLIY